MARNAELEEKDADSVVSSVLEKQDASKTKDGEDGEDKGKADVVANGAGGTDGGGWGIWNAIISKKRSEKGSFLNTALRSFHVFRKSYALILGSMVLVIVALVAVRPSFVLAESTNRFKEPSIDVVRVAVYALAFGARRSRRRCGGKVGLRRGCQQGGQLGDPKVQCGGISERASLQLSQREGGVQRGPVSGVFRGLHRGRVTCA